MINPHLSLQNQLDQLQQEFDLSQIGISDLKSPVTIDFYEKWLAENSYGNMNYLQNHFETKKNPKSLNQQFNSAISITQSYFPAERPLKIKIPARIAMYSQNEDYHHWVKNKLKLIIEKLKMVYPDEVFEPYVDSGPILEKDWAYQSGLGWFGKNTCLIHPKKGSLFFVAEILTSLKAETKAEILPDFCGTCTRCIDICPTGALVSPRNMKADHCISYLTIESKTAPPIELRTKIGDWFFGCDLCQTVCPWNIKIHKTLEQKPQLDLTPENREEIIQFFRVILTSSNKQLQKQFYGTPLFRAAGFGLKRNALIVIANQKLKELESEVLALSKEDKLSELALWSLNQISL